MTDAEFVKAWIRRACSEGFADAGAHFASTKVREAMECAVDFLVDCRNVAGCLETVDNHLANIRKILEE